MISFNSLILFLLYSSEFYTSTFPYLSFGFFTGADHGRSTVLLFSVLLCEGNNMYLEGTSMYNGFFFTPKCCFKYSLFLIYIYSSIFSFCSKLCFLFLYNMLEIISFRTPTRSGPGFTFGGRDLVIYLTYALLEVTCNLPREVRANF